MSYLHERRDNRKLDIHQDRNNLLNYCEKLELALRDACERIADMPQSYEEANTEEGWFDVFVNKYNKSQDREILYVK